MVFFLFSLCLALIILGVLLGVSYWLGVKYLHFLTERTAQPWLYFVSSVVLAVLPGVFFSYYFFTVLLPIQFAKQTVIRNLEGMHELEFSQIEVLDGTALRVSS